LPNPSSALAWALWWGVFPFVALSVLVAYNLFQKPVERVLVQLPAVMNRRSQIEPLAGQT
ncbi:MAG: hypothetical protein ACREEH_03110, partial [Caulobacteraceae bacterium]